MSLLQELEQWYLRQCDGEWEHSFGMRIETIDNPGWVIEVDLAGTRLAAAQLGAVPNSVQRKLNYLDHLAA